MKLIERLTGEQIEELRFSLRGHLRLNIKDDATYAGAVEELNALCDMALSALSAQEQWVQVPREPTRGLLMSIALRLDHGLGCPGYYDQTLLGGKPGDHQRRLDMALADARRAYDEIVGAGFWSQERNADYEAMLAAAPTPEGRTEEG